MNLNLVDLQVNQSFIGAKILSKPINIAQIKWCASSLWSFRPNSAWGSIGTTTIGKTHPTLYLYTDLYAFDEFFKLCPGFPRWVRLALYFVSVGPIFDRYRPWGLHCRFFLLIIHFLLSPSGNMG